MAGRQRDDLERETDPVDSIDPAETADSDDPEAADAAAVDDGDGDAVRSDEVEEYWDDLGIEVVEIALPRGVGLTLRQYRVVEAEDIDEDDEVDDVEDADADAEIEALEDDADVADEDDDPDDDTDDEDRKRPKGKRAADLDDDDRDDDDRDDDDIAAELEDDDEDDEDDEDRKPARSGQAAGEEEVVMLTTDGSLHLFRSPEGLVAFVRAGAPHDLSGAPGWERLVSTIEADHVIPDEEDRYELDLVVDNLRGGPDVWERDLIVAAGEIARDVAYACRLTDVLTVLAPGSPLDDLDEALRKSGFFARRKLRRIGRDQVSLGWRSVIGKVSTAVTWHD